MEGELPLELIELSKKISEERVRKYCDYLDKKDDIKKYDGVDLKNRPGAVLLKKEISDLCDPKKRTLPLIDPMDADNLQPASYKLSLGSEYRIGKEEVKYLSDDNDVLTIPRNGIAVVTTYEWINIPAFVIARWNLKVKMAYKGLVWVGSLQVDPGYQGFLFCPLYNLSHDKQQLVYKKTLFTIDFVTTTPFDERAGCTVWESKEKRSTFSFSGLDRYGLKSAPMAEAEEMGKAIDNLRKEIDNNASVIKRFQGITYAAMAIIVAALTVLATLGATSTSWKPEFFPDWISIVAIGLALAAVLTAIFKK